MNPKTLLTSAAWLTGCLYLLGADAPKLLPFQSRLTDAQSNLIADGPHVVQFKIYDAPVGGSAVWNGEVQKLTVNAGLVSTLLGSKSSLAAVDFNQSLYLELTVDANADGQITAADPPLLPRQAVVPTVFSKESALARKATYSETAGHSLTAGNAAPVGTIISVWAFAPSPEPALWKPCDGATTIPTDSALGRHLTSLGQPLLTPKLDDDRFLMGSIGTGMNGNNQLTLSTNQMPNHSHAISLSGAHSHTLRANLTYGNTEWANRLSRGGFNVEPQTQAIELASTTSNGEHNHVAASAGGGQAFPLINASVGTSTGLKYFKVRYYIKVN